MLPRLGPDLVERQQQHSGLPPNPTHHWRWKPVQKQAPCYDNTVAIPRRQTKHGMMSGSCSGRNTRLLFGSQNLDPLDLEPYQKRPCVLGRTASPAHKLQGTHIWASTITGHRLNAQPEANTASLGQIPQSAGATLPCQYHFATTRQHHVFVT